MGEDVTEKENPDILAYKRTEQEQKVIILNNFTEKELKISAEKEWKSYHKLLGNYEGDCCWEGEEIALKPYETIMLENF